MRLLKLLLVLFVCAAGPAVAGPYEDAVTTHGNDDYATALRLWRTLAEKGDARAQFQLGYAYGFGVGVPQDYGVGVPQDYVLAHQWYNLAASSNEDVVAEARIGRDSRFLFPLIVFQNNAPVCTNDGTGKGEPYAESYDLAKPHR
ncbi:MAG: sel1 repeat family protein [Rhodospirillales bacterium]|nr:sel1 repeat family protein [Rhodospirillales bacterium]